MDAKHSGRSNLYQLEKGGIKYTLVPLTRKNQPKALHAEGKNFLTFMHDPFALMGERKETWEVHFIVVKGDVEIKDLVGAQIPIEVQTLLKEFDSVILEGLPARLPPLCNIQHHIDLISDASLTNLPHYRMSPKKNEIFKRDGRRVAKQGAYSG